MKKDFITVSQNSGQGNASVTITADSNPFANDRSTSLLVRTAGDKSQEVRILQESTPFYMASLIKFSGYPKNVGTLDFLPYFSFVNVGTNDDGSNYPVYHCKIKMNSSNYDFSSDIKYFLMCTFREDLLEDYELELETPSESRYLTLKSSINGLGLKNYEGEIFLSNGTGIVDEVSLRLTNKNDAYDYRTLYQIVFN
nr:MAG: Putative binding domain, N-terminal [Bacteriophage sp.]